MSGGPFRDEPSCGLLEVGLPTRLSVRDGEITLRSAVAADVPAIVALLAEDQLGAARDGVPAGADPGSADDALAPYLQAFARIDADPSHLLVVGESGGAVVATLQLTLLPGLARRGALRAQIEAVRVAASHRSSGLGTALLEWSVEQSRRCGCRLVQLTTDKQRADAHRFYDRLDFVMSHEGFKIEVEPLAD